MIGRAAISGLVSITLLMAVTGFVYADPRLERGVYLVKVLAACAGCHTPKTVSGPGPLLSGGTVFGAGASAVAASNITPDKDTGIGGWTDRQIADAIKSGVRPNGSRIAPPMPQMAYQAMSAPDVDAIVAYLRSVPPVAHPVPASTHLTTQTKPIPIAFHVEAGSATPVSRGRYIAVALSHCVECHTPVSLSALDATARIDTGGRSFRTAAGVFTAPGIRATALKHLTDAELSAIITLGTRPDGSKLEGPMPIRSYAGMRKADLEDLVAFLRSDQTDVR